MNQKFYNNMVYHKKKRLQIRLMMLAKGENIKGFDNFIYFNESGIDLMTDSRGHPKKCTNIKPSIKQYSSHFCQIIIIFSCAK